jgi:transcriptional regulator with XRE-family HTH domain
MSTRLDICLRIASVRLEVAGPRGKSAFAKRLGISPSTYDYYEADRVPPADVLVKIADEAGVDLRWLLTGRASSAGGVPSGHPVLQRAAALLARQPESAAPLAAFLDILSESLKFPVKGSAQTDTAAAPVATAPRDEPASAEAQPPRPPTQTILNGSARESWIPILGRSAAGVPQFWSGESEAEGVTTLKQLAMRHASRQAGRFRPAAAAPEPAGDLSVQLVTLDGPDDQDVAEYVVCEAIRSCHADAFAVRIDGQSMAPEICHGDVVLLSPSAPAIEGRAAVVQLRRQIGVTCKLFRREGGDVHLAPVNEQFAPQSYPAGEVVWALRVLATIRPGKGAGE